VKNRGPSDNSLLVFKKVSPGRGTQKRKKKGKNSGRNKGILGGIVYPRKDEGTPEASQTTKEGGRKGARSGI